MDFLIVCDPGIINLTLINEYISHYGLKYSIFETSNNRIRYLEPCLDEQNTEYLNRQKNYYTIEEDEQLSKLFPQYTISKYSPIENTISTYPKVITLVKKSDNEVVINNVTYRPKVFIEMYDKNYFRTNTKMKLYAKHFVQKNGLPPKLYIFEDEFSKIYVEIIGKDVYLYSPKEVDYEILNIANILAESNGTTVLTTVVSLDNAILPNGYIYNLLALQDTRDMRDTREARDGTLPSLVNGEIAIMNYIKQQKITKWYIRGNFNSWGNTEMQPYNTYMLYINIVITSESQIKIDSGLWINTYPKEDLNLKTGSYTIFFNTLTMEVFVLSDEKTNTKWYIRGTHNNWNYDVPMSVISKHEFFQEIEFKNIDGGNFFKVASSNWKFSYPDENINVPSGRYHIYFDRLTSRIRFKLVDENPTLHISSIKNRENQILLR